MITWEVHALVNRYVHLLEKDAICWHSISGGDVDDVTNNKISNWNRSRRSVSSTEDSDHLVVNLVLELEVLSLLHPVTESRD